MMFKSKLEVKSKISKRLIEVTTCDIDLLGKSFLRFQEYYESPNFHGKVFSLSDYEEYYINKFGTFSYYSDWGGYNIPGLILLPFRRGDFDPLSNEESTFLNLMSSVQSYSYIIGYVTDDITTRNHELSHAFYYIFPSYRETVLEIQNKYDSSIIRKALVSHEYRNNNDILTDEIAAYMLSIDSDIDSLTESKEESDYICKYYSSMREEITQVFDYYLKSYYEA